MLDWCLKPLPQSDMANESNHGPLVKKLAFVSIESAQSGFSIAQIKAHKAEFGLITSHIEGGKQFAGNH